MADQSDISRSNYVELISVDVDSLLMVCNDKYKTVESSLPRILNGIDYQACDTPAATAPPINKFITNVENIPGSLRELIRRPNVILTSFNAVSFLGQDINLDTTASIPTNTSTIPNLPTINFQKFGTSVSCRKNSDKCSIDLHFIDASSLNTGVAPGRALLQTNKALLSGGYDYRLAISKVRGTPEYIGFFAGKQYYKLSLNTLKGFWDNSCENDRIMVDKYAAMISEPINSSAVNIIGVSTANAFTYGFNNQSYGSLSNIAVSSIVRSVGFRMELALTSSGKALDGSWRFDLVPASGLMLNQMFRTSGHTGPLNYQILIDSTKNVSGMADNDFSLNGADLKKVEPADYLRFRSLATKIFCIYVDHRSTGLSLDDDFNYVDSAVGGSDQFEAFRQAIQCGHKFLFILNDETISASQDYYNFVASVGIASAAVVLIDSQTATGGEYFDQISSSINTLCGYVGANTTPGVSAFGSVKELWQGGSLFKGSNLKSLTHFKINSSYTLPDTSSRTPEILVNNESLISYDSVFDRVFYIERSDDASYRLFAMDMKTRERSAIAFLPFLFDNVIGFDNNVPSAQAYDPGMRLLFIGTGSGHLYSVDVTTGKSSEVEVNSIDIVPRSERKYPSITGIGIGYVPSYDYNGVTEFAGHRALFVGFNAAGSQDIKRYSILRSYVYDVLVFNKTGIATKITPIVSLDLPMAGMANLRSFSFMCAPIFNYLIKNLPATPVSEFVANQKLPGLLLCYDILDTNQNLITPESGRCISINPLILNKVFASQAGIQYNLLDTFIIPAYYPVTNRADWVAIDDFGGSVIWASLDTSPTKIMLDYYYVPVPSAGIDNKGIEFFPSIAVLLNSYEVSGNVSSIFFRDSLECSVGVKGVERHDFGPKNMNCWDLNNSSVATVSDSFVGNELVLRYGESVSKNYNLEAGKYFLTITTSDYRTGADDAGQNLTGLVDIITSGGSRFHYLPARLDSTPLEKLKVQSVPFQGVNPTAITTAGSLTYLFDMPAAFNITLKNNLKPGAITSDFDGSKFIPKGVGVYGIKLCKLLDQTVILDGIKDVKLNISVTGIPRQEVNIFSAFVKVTYRDYGRPNVKKVAYREVISDGRSSPYAGSNVPIDCDYSDTCNYWKQNGNGGIPSQYVLNQIRHSDSQLEAITNFKVTDVTLYKNCIWCIPAGSSRYDQATGKYVSTDVADTYSIFFGDFKTDMIVESIEYFFLMNKIIDLNNTPPSCVDNKSNCKPDPATDIVIHLDYTNCNKETKRLTRTINIGSILEVPQDLSKIFPSSRWDYIRPPSANGTALGPPIGNAVNGQVGEWISFKEILDNTSGTGADQCSAPISSQLIYNGTSLTSDRPSGCDIPNPKIGAISLFAKKVKPNFVIADISETSITNEVQYITVPQADGGSYKLTFAKSGVTQTVTVPYNATATALKTILESNTLIGPNNVLVTAVETRSFRIEFVGALKGMAIPIMHPVSNGLIGTYFAFTNRSVVGTKNERQTISNVTASNRAFTIFFNGEQTVTIPNDASLNTVRAALFALPSIGIGNVTVSGQTTNYDGPYTGPWHIDFVGAMAGKNVSRLSTSNKDYVVYVDWIGGIGVNEVQKFSYKANSGRYTLSLYSPAGAFCTTAPIEATASNSDIVTSIIDNCNFYAAEDIGLTLVQNGNVYDWTLEYKGKMTAQPIKQLGIQSVDLVGDEVTVVRIQIGGGKPQKIRWSYSNATAGFYILKFESVDKTIYFSDRIYYNASAADIQSVLESMTLFAPNDVVVVQNDMGVVGSYEYVLTIKKRISALLVTAIFETTLFGSPISYYIVPDGPYPYPLPYCPTLTPKIHGVDGLVCVPFPPDEGDPFAGELCCTPETISIAANKSTFFKIERDLFSPSFQINGKLATVGSLMAARNYKKSIYKPYYLVSNTCVDLVEANYTDEIKSRTIIVIINKKVDLEVPKIRIINRIKSNYPKLDYCRALSFEKNKGGQDFPDILPDKNYNI